MTLLVSLNINKRVSDTLDRVSLRENIDKYESELLVFVDIIRYGSEDDDLSNLINIFVSELSSKHTSLPFSIKVLLKKINKIDAYRIFDKKNEEEYRQATIKKIITLKNKLIKEKNK